MSGCIRQDRINNIILKSETRGSPIADLGVSGKDWYKYRGSHDSYIYQSN